MTVLVSGKKLPVAIKLNDAGADNKSIGSLGVNK